MVRVANTGYSGLINPYGQVVKKLNLNNEGTLSFKLIKKTNETIFRKYGDFIFIVIIFLTILVNLLFKKYLLK